MNIVAAARLVRSNWKAFASSVIVGVVTAVPLTAIFLSFTLPMLESNIRESHRDSVKIAVESVFNVLVLYHNKAQSGEMTEEAAKASAAAHIKAMRYHEKEYFWINDTFPRMIMHPFKPELDGQSVADLKDPNGTKIFVEMADVASKTGEGFVNYMWPKQGEMNPVPKVSYVKLFKPWNWIVGSGVYIDTIQAQVAEVRTKNILAFAFATFLAILISVFSGWKQLRTVVLPVQNAIASLRVQSEELATIARGMNGASAALSGSSAQQSSSVQETAAAVTQVNEMLSRTAQNATQAREEASNTKALAEDGMREVQEMNRSIQEISESNLAIMEAVLKGNQNMADLGKIMEGIASKTQIINDIVFQTKLLSFNASVEAARAGEHGKGFAVVAEEVGNLAQMSGKSAQEISAILDESKNAVRKITEETKRAIEGLLEQNKAKLERGKEVAKKCGEVLEKVVSKAAASNNMSEEISQATSEQARGVEEIKKAITLMEEANGVTLHQLTSTAEMAKRLVERANSLGDLIQELSLVVKSEEKNALEKIAPQEGQLEKPRMAA